MGGGGRHRHRKNAWREAARAGETDAVPDELLELVFLRLPSHLELVRAACTCRHWRLVIAGDGGSFPRRFGSLHVEPSANVTSNYRVDERYQHARPPGRNPVFVPSTRWAGTVAARNLALDFLPRGEFGDCCWELADSRGGLLLLIDVEQPSLVICDPPMRRYRVIPRSAWFHGYDCLGAFLLGGEDAGMRNSLSNFRVMCTLYRHEYGIARACAFTSAHGGRWTSDAARSSTVVYGHEFWSGRGLGPIHFAGSANGSAYWTVGYDIVLALDKDATEFSFSILPDDMEYAALRNKRHAPEYAYQLP